MMNKTFQPDVKDRPAIENIAYLVNYFAQTVETNIPYKAQALLEYTIAVLEGMRDNESTVEKALPEVRRSHKEMVKNGETSARYSPSFWAAVRDISAFCVFSCRGVAVFGPVAATPDDLIETMKAMV